MPGHGHEIVKCKYCSKVIMQCRCMDKNKLVRYEVCGSCAKAIAGGKPALPALRRESVDDVRVSAAELLEEMRHDT